MRINLAIILSLIASACFSQDRMNVVVLLFDDMGYEVLTADTIEDADGNRYPISMPYLNDSIPSVGLTFTNAYSTPICTPSRLSLLTGRYSHRGYHAFRYLHPDERTTAQNCRWAGYNTAIVGKWQLDGGNNYPTVSSRSVQPDTLPNRMGFDRFMLFQNRETDTVARYANPIYNIDGTPLNYPSTSYGPRVDMDTVKALISRWGSGTEPFYIQYMSALPHDPFEPPLGHPDYPDEQNQTINGKDEYYAAMCEYADSLTWELYQHLESEGLLGETLFIITTDNGTPDEPNTPQPIKSVQVSDGSELPARKTYNDYLGTHVPMWVIYDAPNKNFTNGATIDSLVQLEDIYATIADITGNHKHDGHSLMGYLDSEYSIDNRRVVVSWYNTYLQTSSNPIIARNGILEPKGLYHNGQYGYVKEDEEWFDLINDPLLATPISQPSGTDYILTEAALHPTITFVYPDVMKAFAE